MLDTLTFFHLARELDATLNGAFVIKTMPIAPSSLEIHLHQKRKVVFLYFSLSPGRGYVAITNTASYASDFNPPFILLAKKYLERSKIKAVTQLGNDRIIQFTLSSSNPYPKTSTLYLIFECLGKRNNLFLLNEEKRILGSYQQLPSLDQQLEKQSIRLLAPNADYALPPPVKKPDFSATPSFFSATPSFFSATPSFFSATPSLVKPSLTISNAILLSIAEEDKKNQFSQLKAKLEQQVKKLLLKVQRKEIKQKQELEEAKNAENYKLFGDLIFSYISHIKKGDIALNLSEHNITIPLNQALSPKENAIRYYKLYKKGKSGEKKIIEELEKTQNDITYLEEVLLFLTHSINIEALQQLQIEMEETKLIHPKYKPKHKAKKEKTKKDTIMRLISPDNLEVLVGKNHKDNELILHHFSQNNDIWFHASKIPGGHVLLKAGKDNPLQSSIEYAASIAAYFSKGKESRYVDVDYTSRKNVRKISGGKPGMVTYKNFNTIRVIPLTLCYE